MAEKKVTVMVIKTDLACCKCRKKIKKVLCKIPEIQNQIYDDKANTVTITVVCCCPEKIKKKICCKGGESVTGIEIKVPDNSKPTDEKQKHDKSTKDQKPDDKGKDPVVEPSKTTQKQPPGPVPGTCCRECSEGYRGPCYGGYYGTPVPCYVVCGRPVYDSWGCGGGYVYYGCWRGCCAGRCDCANYSSSCCVM